MTTPTTTASTTAIICDDEPRLAEALQAQLQSAWPELQIVALGHSGGEALSLVAEHAPDIAFLDIRMPGLSGMEVARQLAGSPDAPHIVFVTAYDAHAMEAFDARAVDYLLKPVKAARLQETVDRLRAALQTRTPPTTAPQFNAEMLQALQQLVPAQRKTLKWLNCGQGTEIDVIATSEVLFFQSRDKYTAVVTADKERYIRTPLKELMNELDPDEFWQVHRSSVIRVAAIERVLRDEMGRMHVKMRGSPEKIAVSGAFTGLFKQM
jgi:DNA-binding LytR/AlgR family response regulator